MTLELDMPPLGQVPAQPGAFDVPTHIAQACQKAVEAAAAELGVPSSSLRTKTRARPWVLGRQAAMHGVREFTNASYSMIARWFVVDHGTVMHAHRHIDAMKLIDYERTMKLVAAIEDALQPPE